MTDRFYEALSKVAAYCPDKELRIGVNPDTIYEIMREAMTADRCLAIYDREFREDTSFMLNGTKIRLVPMYDIERKERSGR